MKPSKFAVALGLAAVSALSLPVYAQEKVDNSHVERMSYKAEQLEKELHQLQREIDSLKSAHHSKVRKSNKHYQHVVKKQPTSKIYGKGIEEPLYFPHTVFKYGGIAVITSPYIGIRSEFDGADLITNISSINEDLRLLEQSQIMSAALKASGAPQLTYPLIELSGKVEALTLINKPYVGATRGDVDLAAAEFNVLAYINTWALAFMAIDYDGAPPSIGRLGPRTDNSRFFLNKGFVSIGNLNKFPLYTTWGQYFVPFGRYSSNMLSAPLPLTLARTKARAISLGYRQPGNSYVFASTYGFRGDVKTSSRWQGGVNLGYHYSGEKVSAELAVSAIANMADAGGMQDNGGGLPGFAGFGANSSTRRLDRRVPGVDVNGKLFYGPWALIGEYVTAARRFSANDLFFNGRGARPSALNVEASYRFEVFHKPISIAFGYGHTTQAFGLNLPKDRYIAAVNASFIRDTIATIEVRHDVNYNSGTTGGGRTGSNTVASVSGTNGLGHSATMAIAQFGVYF